MKPDQWLPLAGSQAGLATRDQLHRLGFSSNQITHRLNSGRWQAVSSTVVCTTTGPLAPDQRAWAGVLNGGTGACVAGSTALGLAGLKGWERDLITVLVPYQVEVPPRLAGVKYARCRRDMEPLAASGEGIPRLMVEPAALLVAASERSERTAQGLLAAVVQQRLATPGSLRACLAGFKRLCRAPLIRAVLSEMEAGAQSLAEIEVRRMCRRFGLPLPDSQTLRRDRGGRVRFTDCEWQLSGGGVLILEVDGSSTWMCRIGRTTLLGSGR